MITELVRRDGLVAALSGRNEDGIVPFLAFLHKYITNPAYSSILIDVGSVVLGMSLTLTG